LEKLISGLLAGYLCVAALVLAGGAYGAMRKTPTRSYDCTLNELAMTAGVAPKGTTGAPNAPVRLLLRAAVWPYFYATSSSGVSPLDWLILKYDYAPDACRWGRGG